MQSEAELPQGAANALSAGKSKNSPEDPKTTCIEGGCADEGLSSHCMMCPRGVIGGNSRLGYRRLGWRGLHQNAVDFHSGLLCSR